MKHRKANKTAVLRASGAALACALVSALAMGTSAHAQSGGAVSPGGTTPTTPPPTTPPSGTAPTGATQVFPIPTAHKYGDGLGAGRGHQGQDLFAPCGTPTVAVMSAKVVYNGFQKAAGNYVVLRSKLVKRDYVYMHLQSPSLLPKGSFVTMGQEVGLIGDTGRATGCHLHFEIWKGKWYRGGFALDPLPSLQIWDAYS